MEQTQIKQVKLALESFFYKIRLNISLHQASKDKSYITIGDKISDAIKKQILYFAKVNRVTEVLIMSKAVKELTDKDILREIDKMWIPFFAIMEEQDMENFLMRMSQIGGQTALNKLTSPYKFDLQDKRLLNKITRRPGIMADEIDGTTKDWLARTIEQGLRDGASNFDIAKLIRDSADKHASNRSEIIVENEAMMMIGNMHAEVFKRNQIKLVRWLTSRDEAVCPICKANEDAGYVKVGRNFPSGADLPPAHIQCRCFLEPELPNNLEVTWTGKVLKSPETQKE